MFGWVWDGFEKHVGRIDFFVFKTGREYLSCIALYKNNIFGLSPAKHIEILKNLILPYFTVHFYIWASRSSYFRQAGEASRLAALPVVGLLHPGKKHAVQGSPSLRPGTRLPWEVKLLALFER